MSAPPIVWPAIHQTLFAQIAAEADDYLQSIIRITSIPAPTGQEEARARYIEGRWCQWPMPRVVRDGQNNVWACAQEPRRPTLLLAAHMDTVFPDQEIVPERRGQHLAAPGVRDNSTGAAAVVRLAQLFREHAPALFPHFVFACTTGEEGLGNLRGMQALMDHWEDKVDAVIAVDGGLGSVCHRGVGSRRYRIQVSAPGGHSWTDAGNSSAIHALCQGVTRTLQVPLPTSPKTTLNIGTISGGISVNAIAATAESLVDIRSTQEATLHTVSEQILQALAAAGDQPDVQFDAIEVGRRPAGELPADHPLVKAAVMACQAIGIQPELTASSTDANVPLSRGIPAVCIGAARGQGVHTPGEVLRIESIVPGLQHIAEVMLRGLAAFGGEAVIGKHTEKGE